MAGSIQSPMASGVEPHLIRIQVLDVPSPVLLGAAFKVGVGVQCAAGCDLVGSEIAVHGHDGVRVASATLGAVRSSAIGTQFCAEVEIKAPDSEGRFMWEVRFAQPNAESPHHESACTFTCGVAPHPEFLVTLEVIDSNTGEAITDATAILRPSAYRGSEYLSLTDNAGAARVRVPGGEYRVSVAKEGYRSFLRTAEIARDTDIKAETCHGSDLDELFG